MSAILNFDFQKRKQLHFSEENHLNYTKKFCMRHYIFPKTKQTRTSSGPITLPLICAHVLTVILVNIVNINGGVLIPKPIIGSICKNFSLQFSNVLKKQNGNYFYLLLNQWLGYESAKCWPTYFSAWKCRIFRTFRILGITSRSF